MSVSTRTIKFNFPKTGKFLFPLLPGSVEITRVCSAFHAKGRKLGPYARRTPALVFLSVGLLRAREQQPGPGVAQQPLQRPSERNLAQVQ